ncbi:MAG: ABC transporter substrate-binding protein [Treponema sp.]|nr:ABC transporter substrate-binding protein [Treponema sp.]
MKKIILTILALSVLIVSSCGSTSNTSAAEDPVRIEGRISIYTSMYGSVVEDMQRILAGHFPQYQVVFTYGGTGTLQAKIAHEAETGRLGCDILLVAEPSYSLELKARGMLHPYQYRGVSDLAFEHDPEGFWYPVRISNMVLAFNPQRNSRNTLPASFNDFAHDARVRGAISMSSPLTSGTSLASITALRDKYGYDYFNALSRQNVHIDSSAVGIAKLESGEYKVIMVLEESILNMRKEGSRLEVIYPADGTIVIPSTIMIVNDTYSANRNIAAAEEITDWFLSPEGQNAIVALGMHSVRTDFDRLPHDAIPTSEIVANSIPVNWDNVLNNKDEIRNRFEEYVIYGRN